MLFTIAKMQKQPNYPSMDEWTSKLWHIQMVEYYLVFKSKETAICYNMGELWGHYANRNKPVTKRQILYDSISMSNQNHKDRKYNGSCQELKRREKRRVEERVEEKGNLQFQENLWGRMESMIAQQYECI